MKALFISGVKEFILEKLCDYIWSLFRQSLMEGDISLILIFMLILFIAYKYPNLFIIIRTISNYLLKIIINHVIKQIIGL